jgi:hypothetical protein
VAVQHELHVQMTGPYLGVAVAGPATYPKSLGSPRADGSRGLGRCLNVVSGRSSEGEVVELTGFEPVTA